MDRFFSTKSSNIFHLQGHSRDDLWQIRKYVKYVLFDQPQGRENMFSDLFRLNWCNTFFWFTDTEGNVRKIVTITVIIGKVCILSAHTYCGGGLG